MLKYIWPHGNLRLIMLEHLFEFICIHIEYGLKQYNWWNLNSTTIIQNIDSGYTCCIVFSFLFKWTIEFVIMLLNEFYWNNINWWIIIEIWNSTTRILFFFKIQLYPIRNKTFIFYFYFRIINEKNRLACSTDQFISK